MSKNYLDSVMTIGMSEPDIRTAGASSITSDMRRTEAEIGPGNSCEISVMIT